MSLTSDFQFSAHSLQDYVDCPRRFELRYMLRLKWPALESEPALEWERRQELGRRFHEMVHQSCLGLPADTLSSQEMDPELMEWWRQFSTSCLPASIPGRKYPEQSLSAPFFGYRLVAKMDLIIVDVGQRITIIDWKTTPRATPPSFLKQRLQTRIYPYLAVVAGSGLNGGTQVDPSSVEMLYWFPAEPEKTYHHAYNRAQFLADQAYLSGLVREIESRPEGQFLLTPDERKCVYCVFRSYCDRGDQAGILDKATDDDITGTSINIDFEQIGEIEF